MEIERIVCGAIGDGLDAQLSRTLATTELASGDIRKLRDGVGHARRLLDGAGGSEARTLLAAMVLSISLDEDTAGIVCDPTAIDPLLGEK